MSELKTAKEIYLKSKKDNRFVEATHDLSQEEIIIYSAMIEYAKQVLDYAAESAEVEGYFDINDHALSGKKK